IPPMIIRRVSLIAGLVVAIAAAIAVRGQEDPTDAAKLIDALRLVAGSTVAEIGAGSGSLTIAIANTSGRPAACSAANSERAT
ncbi:MAG: hypothetical protein ACT4QD_07160, partial [Acidobacteriota bacterium]